MRNVTLSPPQRKPVSSSSPIRRESTEARQRRTAAWRALIDADANRARAQRAKYFGLDPVPAEPPPTRIGADRGGAELVGERVVAAYVESRAEAL